MSVTDFGALQSAQKRVWSAKIWMAGRDESFWFKNGFVGKTDGRTRTASQLPSLRFSSDVVAASSGRIIHAGSATSEATLTTADKMSWAVIVKSKQTAIRKRLRPIRSGGRDYYCVLMSPEQ